MCARNYNKHKLYVKDLVTEQHLCASDLEEAADACGGDSGGPLTCLDRLYNVHVLCGVVSFGPASCNARTLPGVYTRVSKYRQWIYESIPMSGGPWDEGMECLPARECAGIMARKAVMEATTSERAREALEQELSALRCHDLTLEEALGFVQVVEEKYSCRRTPPSSNWGPWGACSKSCGNGTQERKRLGTLADGAMCFEESPPDIRNCSVVACPGRYQFTMNFGGFSRKLKS